LDDPSNGEFLRDLAKGIVPKELQQGQDGGSTDMTVGLIDKRHLEHDQDVVADGRTAAGASTASFMGEGQSLGRASRVHAQGGIISPPSSTSDLAPVSVKEEEPTTVIQVRLLNGKRLRVRINTTATIEDLVQHIHASGDAGSEDYVLSAGFPPKVLEDLSLTIEKSGLKGAQVIQSKAG